MKRPNKGHLNVIRLECPQCSNNWDQRVIQTGLIETPCTCDLTISMAVTKQSFGVEWIETLFAQTKPLGSFTHDKVSLSVENQIIADSGKLKVV